MIGAISANVADSAGVSAWAEGTACPAVTLEHTPPKTAATMSAGKNHLDIS
jgi:hypothetical protein